MLWEHELQTSVSRALSSSPKLSGASYNSIETRSTSFLFLLGPGVHTNPLWNENGAVLLRIRLSSTLQRRKRSPKTEAFKNALQGGAIWNDACWNCCFQVWTEKMMLSENGDVLKIDMTGRQTTRLWVFKMANIRYHVASISRQFRGPIYWNAHGSSSFEHGHWEYNSVFQTDTAL